MKRHIFETYRLRNDHYPRIRIRNGSQQLTVTFAPGYVHIKTSSPFSGEVYIVRSAWFKLFRQTLATTRLWRRHTHPDFDVPQAVHQAHLAELTHLDDMRRAKRARKRSLADQETADRQRRRFLRARARAARREET